MVQKVVAAADVVTFTTAVRSFMYSSIGSQDNSAYMMISFKGADPRCLVGFYTSKNYEKTEGKTLDPSPMQKNNLMDLHKVNEENEPRLVTFAQAFDILKASGSAKITIRVREKAGSSVSYETEIVHGSAVKLRSEPANNPMLKSAEPIRV